QEGVPKHEKAWGLSESRIEILPYCTCRFHFPETAGKISGVPQNAFQRFPRSARDCVRHPIGSLPWDALGYPRIRVPNRSPLAKEPGFKLLNSIRLTTRHGASPAEVRVRSPAVLAYCSIFCFKASQLSSSRSTKTTMRTISGSHFA